MKPNPYRVRAKTASGKEGYSMYITRVPLDCVWLSVSNYAAVEFDLNFKRFTLLKHLVINDFQGEEITGCDALEILEIRNSNRIKTIESMPNLKTLICSDCKQLYQIESINNIEKVVCENCDNLTILPFLKGEITIQGCPKLQIIDLKELNSLKCISCKELTAIYITNNNTEIKEIECSDCEKLLLISGYGINKVNKTLFNDCFNLFFMICYEINNKKIIKDLSEIPTNCFFLHLYGYNKGDLSLLRFPKLNNLFLENFNSGNIEFGNTINYLELGNDCKVEKLSQSNTIKTLRCMYNSLKEITNLPELKDLYLNDMKDLKLISSLPKLEKLFIQNCENNILINDCENVVMFTCVNSFSNLPTFPNLQYLECNTSKIKEIPIYKKLTHLKCFNLEYVSQLPELENLYLLSCVNCPIKEVPSYKNIKIMNCVSCPDLETIQKFEKIFSFVCLDCNKLSSLPMLSREISIKNCNSVKEIATSGLNKFECDSCLNLSTIFITETSGFESLNISNCENLILVMADPNLQTVKSVSVTNCPKTFVSEKLRINNTESTIDGILEYEFQNYIKINDLPNVYLETI